ncbi:MAG: zinc-binding dehydrogenase, partial [Deltaproteobacteria bacterium]
MPISRKQIIVKRPGAHQALSVEEGLLETPGPGEVQVEVKACGINFADIAVRLGLYGAAKGLYPLTPGLEFSGIVKKTGDK